MVAAEVLEKVALGGASALVSAAVLFETMAAVFVEMQY